MPQHLKSCLFGATALVMALAGPAMAQSPELDTARRLLESAPVIDGHNDLPWALREEFSSDPQAVDLRTDLSGSTRLHTDIVRLRAGGVGGQFWSVYVPASVTPLEAARATFEQIDVVKRMIDAYPDVFELALTADDVERIQGDGRIASLIGMEGGYSIADSLGLLRSFYDAGARYMTLTHSKTTSWADSATDAPRWDGLSPFGETVVLEMNRLGMMVDLSHVSEATMLDAIRVSRAPVIFSHSSARAVTGHTRNVPDAVLRLLPENGGVVMITFVPDFVSEASRQWGMDVQAEIERRGLDTSDYAALEVAMKDWTDVHPRPSATIDDVVAHIEHVREVAGIDHVGLGGDFDGVSSLPVGIAGVDAYPLIIAELLKRGWSEADVRKLTGGNILRVMREVEATAARLQREESPFLMTNPDAAD